MPYKDYYNILGVKRTATPDEIRQGYRRMAHKYHPDVSQEPNAEERFKLVQEAYEVLGTPDKRKKYDEVRPNDSQHTHTKHTNHSNPRRKGGVDVSFFEEISRQEFEKEKGFSDFFDSLFGKKKKYAKAAETPSDHNTPFVTELSLEVEELFQDTIKTIQIQDGQKLQVRIPRGASDGKKVRLPGKGLNGQDILLTIKVREHPWYSIQGNDLYYELPITPWEAALGTQITLNTPKGSVNLRIPPETVTGKKMRLPGRGLGTNHENGDFYVVLLIQTPPAHSPEQKAFYIQMQHLFPWTPRPHLKS